MGIIIRKGKKGTKDDEDKNKSLTEAQKIIVGVSMAYYIMGFTAQP